MINRKIKHAHKKADSWTEMKEKHLSLPSRESVSGVIVQLKNTKMK